jgi:hypothetical protein
MPVSDGNIGFNDITQELYGRIPQPGDNLLQMFEDADSGGFDPTYDIGNAGPGDAMSEFKLFDKNGIYAGTWESFEGVWYKYIPDNITQKYFSAGSLLIRTQVQLKKTANGDTATLDGPITASIEIGGVTVSATGTLSETSDVVTFFINANAGIPDGAYDMATDITITLQDSSGFITNARKINTSTHLHIYGKDTAAYRWQWSSSATDSYPIVYPTAVFSVTPPLVGTVPGFTSPAINVKVTDLAGFSDIEAFVSLVFKLNVIGNDTDGWVALGSSFVLDTDKKLTFNVQTIRNYMDAGNDITDILYTPVIKLVFGNGSFSTYATLDPNSIQQFYKTLVQNDTSFSWEWTTNTEEPESDPEPDPIPESTTDPKTPSDTTSDPKPSEILL